MNHIETSIDVVSPTPIEQSPLKEPSNVEQQQQQQLEEISDWSLLNMTTGVVDNAALIKAKEHAFPSHCYVFTSVEMSPPKFETLEHFLASLPPEQQRQAKKQTQNIIKRCGTCNKANALVLKSCNSCGTELPHETTFSENVLSCFVYGIAKSHIPYTISIRHQSPEYLVFDDILSNSTCHLNVIPTSVHIPDWRFLLLHPQKGLHILKNMIKCAEKVLLEQFLVHDPWRKKFLKESDIDNEEFLKLVLAGLNYPPSQYQLHLQYVTFPVVPFQYYMHLQDKVFTVRRFFPVDYVIKVLELNEPMKVHEKTTVDEIIERYERFGISYDDMFRETCDRITHAQERLANWRLEDFEARLKNGKAFHAHKKHELPENYQNIVQMDKIILQNYGRPYDESKKPSGTYYKYARTIPMRAFP